MILSRRLNTCKTKENSNVDRVKKARTKQTFAFSKATLLTQISCFQSSVIALLDIRKHYQETLLIVCKGLNQLSGLFKSPWNVDRVIM